jgi:hypothetical protein
MGGEAAGQRTVEAVVPDGVEVVGEGLVPASTIAQVFPA